MKSFSYWTVEEVVDEFDLIRRKDNQKFKQWLSHSEKIPEGTHKKLTMISDRIDDGGYTWNETELMMKLIGPLLEQVDYTSTPYETFFTRTISAPYGKETLSGIVDFVLAKGTFSPRQPLFFLHEYKKEHDSSNDPLGQLMISMVAAQLLNQNDQPIYGAYLLGRYWHFVLLDGKDYSVNLGLNAATNIIEVYQALIYVKRKVEELTS
ncbi:MAG: hypothetical protein AAF525_02675 [Pseudomonadota bacterium]